METLKLFLKQLIQYYDSGSYDDAEKLAKNIIKQFPNNKFAWKVLGAVLVKKGKVAEAKLPNQKSVELSPQDAQAHYNLGINYKELGKFEEAVKSYKEAIALKPDYAEAYNNLGSAQQEVGKIDEVEEFYKKALKINPFLEDAHLNLCELMEKLNRLEDGLQIVKNAKKKITKKMSDLFLYKALILYRQKEIKTSYRILKKIKIDKLSNKRKVVYYNLMGNLLNEKKDFKDAFRAFTSMNNEIKNLDHYKTQKADDYFYEIRENVSELKNFNLKLKNNKLIESNSIQPTFLIGFPRSGTTLLDTILRSHSKIDVVEEKPMIEKIIQTTKCKVNVSSIENIDNKTLKKLKTIYFEELKKHTEKGVKSIVIDKLPLNILHLPLINKIFPQAKFILVLRHPLDCILSCWMQNFKLNRAMANMCDLKRIVEFYCTAMEFFVIVKKYIHCKSIKSAMKI